METKLQPGPVLDQLVAIKLMGFSEFGISLRNISRYSTDLSDAWQVVEKMGRWKFTLTSEYDFGGGGSQPRACATAIFDPVITDERPGLLASAPTAAHAICLAALKVIGYDKQD